MIGKTIGPTEGSVHRIMKKAIAVVLLCVVAVAGVLAADAKLFNLVSVGAGFDMFTANAKGYTTITKEPYDIKANGMGVGAGVTAMIDLSAIPDFMKEGWFGYGDIEVFFPDRITIGDDVYDKDSEYTRIGFKAHMEVLRAVDFGIPVKFYFGAGFSYGMVLVTQKKNEQINSSSSQAFGAGLTAIAEYPFGNHFAVNITVSPDFTFLTRVDSSVRYRGTELISRSASLGFGFSLTAKAGVKYIF